MKKTVLLAGIGVCCLAGTLVSFTSNSKDDDKLKRYHVVHQENGELVEYDTVILMSSSYSVEQFLADKNIENKNVEIVKLPQIHGEEVFVDHDGKTRRIVHDFTFDVDTDFEGLPEGDHEFMKVSVIKDGDTKNSVIEVFEGHDGKKVEIICDVDKDGNKSVQKFVNGEEVEVTPEVMEEIAQHLEHEGEAVVVKIDSDEIDMELEKALEEVKEELKKLDIDEEELEKHIEVMIEQRFDELELEKLDGEKKVFIKHIELKNGETDEEIHELIHNEIELLDAHENHELHVMSDDEDFTVVIVTENYKAGSETESNIRVNKNLEGDKITVFPNPTSGVVHIRFKQENKEKTRIQVVDVNGREVFNEDLGKFSGRYEKEINLKEFGSGVYTIKVQQGKKLETSKIIVD